MTATIDRASSARPLPGERPTGPGFTVVAAALSLTGLLVAVSTLTGLGWTGRSAVTTGWWLLGPGVALVGAWHRRLDALTGAVAVAASLALVILVGQGMLSTGLWHPVPVAGILGVLVSAALAAVAVTGARDTAAGRDGDAAQPRTETPLTGRVAPVVLALAAAALWPWGVLGSSPAEAGPAGLAGVVGAGTWISYLLLALAVGLEVRGAARGWLLALLSVAAVVGIFGLRSLFADVAGDTTGWLHWGFASQIARDGHVLANFDARYSWPGFFAAAAFLKEAGAIGAPEELLRWTPLVLGAAATAAVRVWARSLLGPGVRSWIAVLVFVCANWVGQEYFSPQGATYVVVLATIGLLLHLESRVHGPVLLRARHVAGRRTPAVRTRTTVAIVVAASLAIAPAHQLSPWFLVLFLLPLAVAGRLPRWIPAVPVVIVVLWWVTGGRAFWENNLPAMIDGFGQLGSSVSRNVGDRFNGAPVRRVIIGLRIASAGLLLVLAAVGIERLRRTGGHWRTSVVWALLPFAAVLAQSYGGEIIMRSLYFALPALAVSAALAVPLRSRSPEPGELDFVAPSGRWLRIRETGPLGAVALVVVLSALLATTVTIRGQNDAFNTFTPDDLSASEAAYAVARPGDTLATLTAAAPTRYAEIGVVRQISLQNLCPPSQVDAACVESAAPDVLVLTRSEQAQGVIFYGRGAGWMDEIGDDLVADGTYREVSASGQSRVLELQR
ncbi:hypothetical protein ACFQ46_01200 [Kineococcus sp. GCM10028916]|uniref:hypothetical protein n=1 Tax=Kineococcus sp. GCM10028916 TaxID=3273394 RepID=UPI003628330F